MPLIKIPLRHNLISSTPSYIYQLYSLIFKLLVIHVLQQVLLCPQTPTEGGKVVIDVPVANVIEIIIEFPVGILCHVRELKVEVCYEGIYFTNT